MTTETRRDEVERIIREGFAENTDLNQHLRGDDEAMTHNNEWEEVRHKVARAIHAADYPNGCVDIEIEWDNCEEVRMRQADAALSAAGFSNLLSDLADMNAYIRQRDDAMDDLKISMQRLDDWEDGDIQVTEAMLEKFNSVWASERGLPIETLTPEQKARWLASLRAALTAALKP